MKTREQTLLDEYHELTDVTRPSKAQRKRLREVESELDAIDADDPVELAASARLEEIGVALDAMLAELDQYPAKAG
jgi:hypothetical protein